MMDTLVARYAEQLREALQIGAAATIRKHTSPIRNIYVSGLGGSGIGANFVAEFIKDECKLPFQVGKCYDIPKYINKHTLVMVSSYSGNTEETLSAFDLLLQTGAKIVCIASGGKVIARAKELGLDYIKVPDNWPSPRACLGYSLVQQLYVLQKLKIIPSKYTKQIAKAADLLDKEESNIRTIARKTANALRGKMPIIYTTDRMEAVAIRFRQQVNENAKLLCWHHIVPEMNHNELVGWRDEMPDHAVVYFRNKDDFERNQMRIEINKQVIGKYCKTILELQSKGKSLIEKAMYFVHLGDWISVYMAADRNVDAIEVKVIDHLKNELGKVK
ncbi:MAG: bifunctional phosphoglucose/phosphomannose isomerase [Saprospiraceae bacterium]|nr:bifunctional phosphoglucose/phosphomannose isomerase [Saprospiraceae bacterium]MBP7679492.1 bifunctional phosphoglucose/phosphomannose isomerase [Saprospiraceae bacterium]